MKKRLSVVFIIIVLLFVNLISSVSYALEPEDLVKDDENDKRIAGDTEGLINELDRGNLKLELNGQTRNVSNRLGTTTHSGAWGILINIWNFLPKTGNFILSSVIKSVEDNDDIINYTIYDTVTGGYSVFNFNFGDFEFQLKDENGSNISNGGSNGDSNFIKSIKQSTKTIYNILRNLSIAISLFVLLYIGIRMALSTTSSKKAKYKKMLTDWAVSLMLVFVLHLIVLILSYISEVGLGIIRQYAHNLNVDRVELGITRGLMKDLSGKAGFNLITTVLTFSFLVLIQFKFFIMYTKRICEITFLTVVSPLVTITYAIDKVGDGKAQAFNNWLKELVTKVAIQWVHAVAYILFIIVAAAIAQKAPFIAVLFFTGLSRGEKVIRNLFEVKDRSFDDEKIPFIE